MLATTIGASPNKYARVAGIAYLIIILAGLLGEMFVRNTLVVPGDAAATAQRIAAAPQLWRAGIAGDLLMHVLDVLVMLMLYTLLRPVSKKLALMALLFNVVQTAVLALNKLNLLVPLFLLSKSAYLGPLEPAQREALAYVFIQAHGYGFGIGLIFFGFTCLLEGYLIRRSGYLPRLLGGMMQAAGVCYIANSLLLILAPELANSLFPFIMLPPFLGESAFAAWLVIRGVDVHQWQEAKRARRAKQRAATATYSTV
ncbi:DUF4386 domain-containing protein [Hymenobacter oligotrophus]|uniref:DUF4386 domain-containing protein n=1 Tax=Hymenobacter oligotrophus TaxID=2319843 RepID=A0A3B7R157_9BACT|nr:DUF4386 domain-containing protein [Hymenobacter oligotrophus]AYA37725.1 DUF4386 domain-containing protein [Hymenobacter oligotrophus]